VNDWQIRGIAHLKTKNSEAVTDSRSYCRELQEGVPVSDINGNRIGNSKIAAQRGITLVTVSRIGMAAPGMGG
jgi:hypothetical protein